MVGNLPAPVTSFVGREREIEEVERLLTTTRLLTLTGTGGCGKTRLGLEVAAQASDAFADGVWLVELAALSDPALVPQAVASAVGAREVPGRAPTESLTVYLGDRLLLLVLDNCEHLVAGAAQLADALLRTCPHVRILATSREPLGSAGETTWRVPSLSLPPPVGAASDEPRLEAVRRSEALQLFIERARAARPEFTPTDHNAPALADICRRLDGIPLAIELAAARVRVFSVEQIAARLDDRFHLLTTGPRTAMPRQQTLQATVDWSYDLLAEPERALLRRLSVFAGGWTFEAADAVAAADGIHSYALLDVLSQLVDKSLVIADEHRGAVRYRLLETIRQYGRERLQDAGELERMRARHLAYFLRLAETAEHKLRGADARVWMDRLAEDHDNLRLAVEWALVSSGGDVALRLTGALAWFWWARDAHTEGRRWLERALAAAPDRSPARMKALHGAGWVAHHQRDADAARRLLGESLAIARELDDTWTVAWALHGLGRVAYFENDPAATRSLAQQSLAVAEEAGDEWLIAFALHLLGIASYLEADHPTARAYYERSLAMRQRIGYPEGIGILQALLGLVALRERDFERAHALFVEALATTRDLLGSWSIGNMLLCFASLAAAQGHWVRAVRLGGFSTAIWESWQTPAIPLMEAALAEGLERARQALDPQAYAAAWAAGRALSPEDAVAEALAVEAEPPVSEAPRRSGAPLAGLTPTEIQVLRLLADGWTTKEIAADLVVAVSTVDRHITHIYGKLGVRNRAEATAFALKHTLA
jgi:non-specific serine/threonine protein kinase